MPYFVKAEDGQFCVHKGTEDDDQGRISGGCHKTRGEATGHMRALYVNVEDADKAAVSNTVGSLIHGSGGILNPMRDGDNGDAQESACTCPECEHESKKIGSVACEDRLCPKCGSEMQAKENDMEDKEKETWDSAYVAKLPNSAFLYVESGNGETPKGKRHLPYKNAEGQVDLPHLRNAISRLGQSGTGTGKNGWLTTDLRKRLMTKAQGILKKHSGGENKPAGDDKKSVDVEVESDIDQKFTVYKSGDTWRWLAISNVAIRDREGEIVTEKAYNDAIAYAREKGAGALDLVHVDGTDVGVCDLQHVLNGQLIEGGTWYSIKRAASARESVQSDPDYWGVSIKFEFDPDQFDGQTYQGGIRILKRSILPRHMAASYGTAIAVTGGEQMKVLDEETKQALAALGVSEDEIVALAEKQVGDEANVKTKEEDTKAEAEAIPEPPEPIPTISIPQKTSFFQGLKSAVGAFTENWFTAEVQAKAESTEPETAEPEVEKQPSAEKGVKPEIEVEDKQQSSPEKHPETDQTQAVMEAFGQAVAKSVGDAIAPLQQVITQQQKQLATMQKRLEETEKDIETKVIERLESQPPIVKVQASHARSTVTDGSAVGLDVTQKKQVQSYVSKLMSDIGTEVAKKVSHAVANGRFEV